ncbi:ABC-type transport auxiliary lipoprotein family protein [Skermanella mucosa]|uniref:ABC-type transport auxiliary lipoprotein family protein n=1 Tax=Skermanella mucosa TaxID=1789672 RepID=UPI00192BED73|nr:ABC-type transport auxiliary lipoprotein family protein [Skermanella mucosa]UEM19554.1 ABC-type transport auxiliary lipoprotein family protein [Skermanella mucosa]
MRQSGPIPLFARLLPACCIALGLLAGCSLPGFAPPPKLYTLTPKNTFSEGLPVVRSQILIEPPVAAAGIDTGRIALSRAPTSLDYYADVSWTDRAPAMVQTLMVESFENSGKVISVGRDTIGLRSDIILKSELREFQAEYDPAVENAPPRIHVRINAKLVAMPRRSIEASKTFESFEPARGLGFEDIIAAYDEALGKVLRRLVEWSLAETARLDRESPRRNS